MEQLRLTAELASDLVYQTNPAGIIEWVSPSVIHVLGWNPAEITGSPSIDLVHPEDAPGVQAVGARSYAGETVEEHVIRLRTKQGEYRWMSVRFRPVTDDRGTISAMAVGARDVHEATIAGKAAQALAQADSALLRATGEGGLLQRVCDILVENGRYRAAWYGRPVNDAAKSVVQVARAGNHRGYLDQVRVTWGDAATAMGPTGNTIRTGKIQDCRDLQNDPKTGPWHAAAIAAGFGSSLALPVFVDGQIDGVLNVYGAEAGEFDHEAQTTLAGLADDIGQGLARLRDRAKIADALVNGVDLLAATVKTRDTYAASHQSDVSTLAMRLGQVLGLDDNQLLGLKLGANIRDLGNIVIAPEILSKPGRLTPEEFDQVRSHAEAGWQIAKRFHWPWPIAEMIHQHHERFDGSGYPQGLRGEQIVREARIIAVADVYDAISHDRPHRRSPGEARALEILTAAKGTEFEPDVVDALQQVLATGYTSGTVLKP
ncbi:MAG: GAF domain-containing protein [Phycicoccus sp.]|nr:GAF domain-containing protein [Phycicoccus sp.]